MSAAVRRASRGTRPGWRAVRRRNVAVVDSAPSNWPITCDGCGIRRKRGIVLVALGADVQLCRACLRRAQFVITEALGALDRG